MRKTLIEPTKRYWAIIRTSDILGHHTGKAFSEVALVEFDNILHLEELIDDTSVEAAESMGAYSFEVLTMYTSRKQFEQDCEFERDIQKERNDEYNKSYDPTDDDSDPDDCSEAMQDSEDIDAEIERI